MTKTLDLKAETKATRLLIAGKNTGSVFGEDSIMETVEVDVLKKPMTSAEYKAEIDKNLNGKTKDEYRMGLIDFVQEKVNEQNEKDRQKILDEKPSATLVKKLEKEAENQGLTGKAATDYVNKWIAQNKESRIAENSAKNQEKSQGVLSDLRHFNIGNSYMIPVSAQITPTTGFVNAKFLGFKMKDKINPSSILASFATHDGRRKVDIPLSQVNFMNAIKARRTTAWEMLSDEKWDNTIPTSTRKTAYIATGNLLQALS